MSITLVEMLEKNAAVQTGKAAVIFGDSRLTWPEFNEKVNRFSDGMVRLGLESGDRIGLMLPRVPELLIGFMAAAKAKAVVAPVNYELTPDRISNQLKSIEPRFLIVHRNFLDHALKSLPEEHNTRIIVTESGSESQLSFDGLIKAGSPVNPGLHISPEDVVYLNYTSGSTGDSKGAVTTHSNIYWNTLASVDALALAPDDVHICMFAPFAHPHELFARALYLGGTIVLVDNVYPKSLAEAITAHGVTCVMGLAPMYENLLELQQYREYDLSTLRIPESGGMYTRPELMQAFKNKLGIDIVPVWGSTETSGIALANRYGERIIPGSIGRPCLSYSVRIVDENGVELPAGEVGEMAFKGPAVVSGYYGMAQAGSQFKDGWYFSGDLARKDEDGYFYFVERKSGMMKVAGLKVYPAEIEMVLLSHPGIREVSVIAAKDTLRGEVPKAIIVLKEEASLTQKDVFRFCKGVLPNYKIPRIIEFRDALPKTGSGKINKKALQMEYA